MEELRFSQVAGEVAEGLRRIGDKKFAEAETLLKAGLARSEPGGFRTELALFQSAFGFLEKARGNMKEAWRWYEKAEKTFPDDPALKIISARFLIEQFAQPDAAIKRAKRVLKLCPQSRPFLHHAYVTLGLAYLAKGGKKQAAEMLDKSMEDDFAGMISPENIDLHLVEAFVKREMEMERCRTFLVKAHRFAETVRDAKMSQTFSNLLAYFDRSATTAPPNPLG